MAAPGASVVLATASYDHTVKLWDPASGKSWLTIKVPDTQVNSMALCPGGVEHVACAGNPNILVFDYGGDVAAPSTSYTGHSSNVTAVGYQREGRWLFSASEDKTVKVWDVRAAGCQREMENSAPVNAAALHPNQVELIYGDQTGSLKVWDLRSNTCTRSLVPSGKVEIPLRSISVSANGKRVVAGNNKGQCFVWRLGGDDTSMFDAYTKLDAHGTYVTSVAISPDCKYVATSSADASVKVFDMKAVWSSDSTMLVTASSDGLAKLWNVASGEVMREYAEHTKTVSAICLVDTARR